LASVLFEYLKKSEDNPGWGVNSSGYREIMEEVLKKL